LFDRKLLSLYANRQQTKDGKKAECRNAKGQGDLYQ
jgi:hypothetical protein